MTSSAQLQWRPHRCELTGASYTHHKNIHTTMTHAAANTHLFEPHRSSFTLTHPHPRSRDGCSAERAHTRAHTPRLHTDDTSSSRGTPSKSAKATVTDALLHQGADEAVSSAVCIRANGWPALRLAALLHNTPTDPVTTHRLIQSSHETNLTGCGCWPLRAAGTTLSLNASQSPGSITAGSTTQTHTRTDHRKQ